MTITPSLTGQGKVIVVALPAKTLREVGTLGTILWKLAFQRYAERRDIRIDPRPVFLWADEGHLSLTSNDHSFQSTCRSSRVATVLLSQNISNFYAALGGGERGKAEADSLLGHFATRTYYKCSQSSQPGHPDSRLAEREIDEQVLEFFGRLEVKDPNVRQWIVEVIRAKANADNTQNRQHRDELARQKKQVEEKLKTLLDLRVEGEISSDEYVVKRRELNERQTGIRLQLEVADRDDHEIVEQAVKAFELSQTLKTRWKTADPASKRTILDIHCESIRSNSRKVLFSARKPFNLLENAVLTLESGAEETRTLNP